MIEMENKIFKDLYESVDGLFAYTFYSRYKIRPDTIVKFISKYTEKGLINYYSNKIQLTNEGRNIVLKQKFAKSNKKGKFSNIPQEFLNVKLEINEPYLPNSKEVPAEILNKQGVVE